MRTRRRPPRPVDEIVAAGGEAVADTNDVSSPAGAQALVDAAVEQFGRIDVLVNNAGIIRWAGMPEVDADNLAKHLAVHVGGSFNTVRAAWPHLVDQGYGRIVNTTSAGLFGLPDNTSYATAKGAVVGLTRSLATAGAAHGITANCIAPGAMTRMAGRAGDDAGPEMSPDLVAPMVALLAHEECPVSGEIYAAGFGRFARIFIGMAPGYVHTGSAPRSRTSPSSGRRSTTSPATASRPTCPSGRRPSWPTCSRASSCATTRSPLSSGGPYRPTSMAETSQSFRTTLLASGGNNVGIVVPTDVVTAFGRGKRVPVVVTVDGGQYRSTIASMGAGS